MILSVVIPTVHVMACLFLIVVVLLQTGKGADMGAVFGGGGSQTLFGATGAGNLLTKLTTAMAVTFMLTSLTLAVTHQGRRGSGLIERLPDAAPLVLPPPTASEQAPIVPAPGATDEGTNDTGTNDTGTTDTATPEDVAASEPSDAAPAAAPVPDAPVDPEPSTPTADGAAPTP